MKVVVRITSAIELECSLQGDPLASGGRLDVCLLCSIETIYIALMVLSVMKLHDLSRDVRFQGLEIRSRQHDDDKSITSVTEFSLHRGRMEGQEVCGLRLCVERASAKG